MESKFCVSCGSEIDSAAQICPRCGNRQVLEEDSYGEGLSVLGKVASVMMPLIGLILYLIHKGNANNKAKDACNFALIGIAMGIVFNVISALIGL